MELLGIKDVSTQRQKNNDTRVWRLPIKNKWKSGSFIEVASFKTGYVRNQNSGYSNYQLNKRCDGEAEYYNINPPNKEPLYRKFTTRSCVLIPKEVDRLEYLIAYCLKNYYIKHANFVAEGSYVSKWEHEYELERTVKKYEDNTELGFYSQHDKVKELEDRVYELESQVDVADKKIAQDCGHYDRIKELESDVHNLENKLATIERIASDRNKWEKE